MADTEDGAVQGPATQAAPAAAIDLPDGTRLGAWADAAMIGEVIGQVCLATGADILFV